jgi:hypothetical protein
MFHEIDQDKIDRVRGMDITFVTSADQRRRGPRAAARWASRSRLPGERPEEGHRPQARLHWLQEPDQEADERK